MRGLSEMAVRKTIASGRIRVEVDGTIGPARADAQSDSQTDPAKQRGLHTHTLGARTIAGTVCRIASAHRSQCCTPCRMPASKSAAVRRQAGPSDSNGPIVLHAGSRFAAIHAGAAIAIARSARVPLQHRRSSLSSEALVHDTGHVS